VRNNVTFRYPAEYIGTEEDNAGVLAVGGAGWFVHLLQRVEGLNLEPELCQEDWGVVVFGARGGKQFWIGLSGYDEELWIAHFHHASLAWLQRLSRSGNNELQRLITDFHEVLSNDKSASQIAWYAEHEMRKPKPRGFPTPT
jgi:hypothetical protein